MENPATWNAIQKLIARTIRDADEARARGVVGLSTATQIYIALRVGGWITNEQNERAELAASIERYMDGRVPRQSPPSTESIVARRVRRFDRNEKHSTPRPGKEPTPPIQCQICGLPSTQNPCESCLSEEQIRKRILESD